MRLFVVTLAASAIALSVGCQVQGKREALSPLPNPTTTPSAEILYILDNLSATTYTVDPGGLKPLLAGGSVDLLPPSSIFLQFLPSPDDHFLYVLWSDTHQQEHLSTHATDMLGVPQVPAIQIMDVSSLSQLNIHPSGKFMYAMELDNSTGAYISKLLLFHTSSSGILELDSGVQGTYGPALLPTLLSGISPDGSQLYLTSQDANGPLYWERAVNEQNGTLAPDNVLFQPPSRDSVVLGATLVIDYQNAFDYSYPAYLNILLNEPEPPQQVIRCTSTMLGACQTATNVQLDPSGNYLFLTDPPSQRVRVARIDLGANNVADTDNFLPFTALTPGFAFSPDGTLIYALLASDFSLHVYRFDQTTGNLTEGDSSIPIPSSAGFSPALRR